MYLNYKHILEFLKSFLYFKQYTKFLKILTNLKILPMFLTNFMGFKKCPQIQKMFPDNKITWIWKLFMYFKKCLEIFFSEFQRMFTNFGNVSGFSRNVQKLEKITGWKETYSLCTYINGIKIQSRSLLFVSLTKYINETIKN